ncbi:MAG: hypothetical protein WC440_03765 [Candidatus Omnitrophota bacterium]
MQPEIGMKVKYVGFVEPHDKKTGAIISVGEEPTGRGANKGKLWVKIKPDDGGEPVERCFDTKEDGSPQYENCLPIESELEVSF